MNETINKRFQEHEKVISDTLSALSDRIVETAQAIIESCRGGGEVFVFGNGGSAADAQHLAGELVGRYLRERPAIKARALTTDTSVITSVANDYTYDKIFSRQLEGAARKGDVAIGLSTSGHSPNVVEALMYGREHGIKTIAVTGADGGRCGETADILINVPSEDTPRVQEATVLIYHLICELVEAELAG